jgi:ABC-type dipeptide/oligopeptide/nickel transport system permease subunit
MRPSSYWGRLGSQRLSRRRMLKAGAAAGLGAAGLSLTVLAFNMLGDALRDILDPRLRQGRR